MVQNKCWLSDYDATLFPIGSIKGDEEENNTISKKLVLALQSNKGLALEKLGKFKEAEDSFTKAREFGYQ